MGLDRFIRWGDPPVWGSPNIEKLTRVLEDFLGPRWRVNVKAPWIVAECDDPCTLALTSEMEFETAMRQVNLMNDRGPRGFEVFYNQTQTSVITRQADEFTCALADRYAAIIARWWNGTVETG